MSLRNFYIKSAYNSKFDNPYAEFFIPALKNSNSYWRYGGFFNSKNLALCAEGIQEFLENDGKIRLVLSPHMNKEDIIAIKEGISTPEKFINDSWGKNFANIKDKIEKDHLRALSWLIAQNPPRLEIKIAVFKNDEGIPLTGDEISKKGIAEQTFGIFHDEEGNAISFKGVIKNDLVNEDNFYDFNVFKNWISGQKEYVEENYSRFIEFWDELSFIEDHDKSENKVNVEIIDLPIAIKENLLEWTPKNIKELELRKLPKLKPYQKTAVNSWISHGKRGIFQMATGTGKTFCAIACIKELEKTSKQLLIIIVCPTQNLIKQWQGELEKWGYESKTTLSGKDKWTIELKRLINDLNYGIKLKQNVNIIISTYATFNKVEFVGIMENCQIDSLVIADEVHSAGSEETSRGLLNNYDYRIGLSATPSRYFDDEGTKKIMKYFEPLQKCYECSKHGSIIFSFELKDAIPKYLVEYDYFPYYVELNDDELEEYKRKSKTIAMKLSQAKDSREESELISLIVFERANIIKNAANKIQKFREIILDNSSIDYCIVYCAPSKKNNEDDQMTQVQKILNEIPISNHRIKSGEITLNERLEVLENLETGLFKVVEAIQILDEGVDIPPLKNAILLASTGNPKQFIQRRGRVLRRWGGVYPDGTIKDHATIHDIFVIPYLEREIDPELLTVEKIIIEKELRRHEEMAKLSRNPNTGLEKIKKIREKYKLN